MDRQKDVLHVNDELSTRFEVSQVMKSFDRGGPILLFEKLKDFDGKIAANISGTRRRIAAALNVNSDQLYARLAEAWHSPRKPKIAKYDSEEASVESTVDLSKIPVLTHFEKDAGPYITSAIVHAGSVDGQVDNLSVHRLQVLGKRHLAIRLVPRHLFKLWKAAKEHGRDLEVAIAIGVNPAVLIAASSPLPFGVSEYDVADALMDGNLRLAQCKHVNAVAPADAELVLEGRISATKEVAEGPFVDITGTYDIQRKQPVVEVVGVSHRENFIYHALMPSGAEHRLLMGLPREVLIWEAVSKVVPKVFAVNLTSGGSGWLHAVVSIEKQLDGDGKNALLAAFAAHPSLKHAVVVDSDIDVFDASDVEWAIATRFQASEDLIVVKNARGSTLDSSADQETGLTTKVGLDATRPFAKPMEKFERAKIPSSKRVETLVQRFRTARKRGSAVSLNS
jgi:2,5-furandicarboxylate decarboxylase 1